MLHPPELELGQVEAALGLRERIGLGRLLLEEAVDGPGVAVARRLFKLGGSGPEAGPAEEVGDFRPLVGERRDPVRQRALLEDLDALEGVLGAASPKPDGAHPGSGGEGARQDGTAVDGLAGGPGLGLVGGLDEAHGSIKTVRARARRQEVVKVS